MDKQIKIALAGNPNCGKTTLFNALTGSNQFVGNWPGVTVEKKTTLGTLTSEVQIYPQLLENLRVTDKKAVLEHPEVKKAIAEVTEALGSDGRILVRESGTEPLLRVMVEATTQELCKEYVGKVIDTMKRIM